MTDLPTHQVRNNVHRILALHGAPLDQIRESILIRDGFYCGRRFCAEGLQAVWFVEENELKVYDSDGAILLVTAADAPQETTLPTTPLRRAA